MHYSLRSLPGEGVRLWRDVRLEDDLGDPLAVAQVDEHRAAVVAAVCTQPKRMTSLPTSAAVSWPQVWVRLISVMYLTAMEVRLLLVSKTADRM